MGSPVSVVVAEIVMQNIEEQALATYSETLPPWLRYVDDTITAVHESKIDEFHEHLNEQNTKVAFTRTLFHLKPHRFRCGYAFCLHDTDRDRCRNRVDLKTLPKVERFQNDTVSSDV